MSQPAISDPLHYNYQSHSPTRTLFFLLDQKLWYYSVVYIIFILKHSPAWLLPFVIALMIDTLNEPAEHHLQTLIILGSIHVILLFTNIPLQVRFSMMMSRVIRRLETRLRYALITRLHHLSFSFLDEAKSGKLEAKILRDVEQVQFMCWHVGQFAPMAVSNVLIAVIYTAIKEPMMLIFFAVQVPISIALLRFFRGSMKEKNAAFRVEVENMNSDVSESIDMIPVSRAHAVEKATEESLEKKFRSVEQQGIELDRFNALFGSSSWVTFQASIIIALLVSFYLAWHGYISVGDVVLYQGLFAMIVHSIESITNSFPIVARGIESVRSIGEVIECPDLEMNEGKKEIDSIDGEVEFDNIEFAYTPDADPALRGFSLHVQPGETVALVGHSGSGKTTLMGLLIGFRRARKGRILLDGVDMEEIDMRSWRRFISVVPQQPLLISGTIRENIAYGMTDISDEEILDAIKNANLKEFVDSLPEGIYTKIGEGGASLSGGQRQRVAIARAFVRNPKLIILDEATSALDVVSEREVQEAIKRLSEGRTTFIIAHRLSTIRDAGRIVVLSKGEIVEMGPPDELMEKQGAFYEMSTLQA